MCERERLTKVEESQAELFQPAAQLLFIQPAHSPDTFVVVETEVTPTFDDESLVTYKLCHEHWFVAGLATVLFSFETLD